MKNIDSASYSILNAWKQGQREEALKSYFNIPRPVTPQMIAGRKFHKQWQKETEATGKLPRIFGDKQLNNPKCEQKYVIDLTGRLSWLTLVGVLDTETETEIFDYKSGISSSSQYANNEQIYMYALMKYLLGDPKQMGVVFHYNQYIKKVDVSYAWFTKARLKKVSDWIENVASDMYSVIVKENYYEKYGSAKNKKYGRKAKITS